MFKDGKWVPDKPQIPYTNFHYPNSIHKLPKIYDNAKRYKDEDGDEYIHIDRIYGGLYDVRLIQKDGSTYEGKLHKSLNGYRYTDDGRWFDNGGLPIEKPTHK